LCSRSISFLGEDGVPAVKHAELWRGQWPPKQMHRPILDTCFAFRGNNSSPHQIQAQLHTFVDLVRVLEKYRFSNLMRRIPMAQKKRMVRSRRQQSLASLFVLMAGIVLSRTALAAFHFATCVTSGWDTNVPSEIGALEYVKQSTSPAGGPVDMTLYNFNTSQSVTVFTNPNVLFLQPSFGFFVTELGFDKLNISGQGVPIFNYSGSVNSSTVSLVRSADMWDTGIGSSDVAYINASWTSDFNVASNAPPTVAQVAPRCKSNQSIAAFNNIQLIPNTRVDGLLIKPGDVNYMTVLQPANRTMVIRMDALSTSAGGDFDLYVSTSSSTPDDANFQWRGFTGLPSEALQIPQSASARTLYIGVHSYAPANSTGHYALSADVVTTPTAGKVCVTDSTFTGHPTLTPAQFTSLRQFLQAGSAYLYGFTNGIAWRNAYTLNTGWTGTCNANNTGCEICIVNDATDVSFGRLVAGNKVGHIEMHGANWSQGAALGWLFAHESGHACFGLSDGSGTVDEYEQPPAGDLSNGVCGHTTMANHSKALAFCSLAHCKDGQVSDNVLCPIGSLSNWQRIIATTSWSTGYQGPLFANTTTAYPTPSWNDQNLRDLVTTNF